MPWFLWDMLGRPPGRHRASCLPPAARAGCRPTPWLVYFRVMGAWARRRWSAVRSLPQDSVLFANALESGPFSQGQHGCICKNNRESAGTLADNAGLRGGKRPFCQHKQQGRGWGGAEEGCAAQNQSVHPPASTPVGCSQA